MLYEFKNSRSSFSVLVSAESLSTSLAAMYVIVPVTREMEKCDQERPKGCHRGRNERLDWGVSGNEGILDHI